MHAERLLLAADIMEKAKPENVEMASWGYEKQGCGFAGCIAGHCSLNPQFNEWGLKNRTQLGGRVSHLEFSDEIKDLSEAPFCEYHNLAVLFDIPESDADDLFSAIGRNYSKSPQEIAATLRQYVKDNPKVQYAVEGNGDE